MKQKLDANQVCLICYEVKPKEEGKAIIRFNSFIEFTCFECEKNCGACGQFFGKDEADEIGFHSAKFCDVSEENN